MVKIGYFFDNADLSHVNKGDYDEFYLVSEENERDMFNHVFTKLVEGDIVYSNNFATMVRTNNLLKGMLRVLELSNADLVLLDDNLSSLGNRKYFFKVANAIIYFDYEAKSRAVKSGMKKAVREGKRVGRKSLPDDKIQEALSLYHLNTMSIKELCKHVGISQATLYKYINEEKELQKG